MQRRESLDILQDLCFYQAQYLTPKTLSGSDTTSEGTARDYRADGWIVPQRRWRRSEYRLLFAACPRQTTRLAGIRVNPFPRLHSSSSCIPGEMSTWHLDEESILLHMYAMYALTDGRGC